MPPSWKWGCGGSPPRKLEMVASGEFYGLNFTHILTKFSHKIMTTICHKLISLSLSPSLSLSLSLSLSICMQSHFWHQGSYAPDWIILLNTPAVLVQK